MDLIRDLAPTVRILAIQSSVTRGIWAQRLSGRDKRWLRPFVPGSSKCRSPDLRKESGLCIFSIQQIPSPLGRSVSAAVRLLLNNSDAVDQSRNGAGCPHTAGIRARQNSGVLLACSSHMG